MEDILSDKKVWLFSAWLIKNPYCIKINVKERYLHLLDSTELKEWERGNFNDSPHERVVWLVQHKHCCKEDKNSIKIPSKLGIFSNKQRWFPVESKWTNQETATLDHLIAFFQLIIKEIFRSHSFQKLLSEIIFMCNHLSSSEQTTSLCSFNYSRLRKDERQKHKPW